ncbi:unnamed protein product [Rotaria magnacalcarata]|uniref:Uncharacterized protein n=2 Tax=Rotaria magnacalcarata TaxID=392030 RepID=A0A815MT52_9BILA|nr:unnamed protein product [Rotaria magnacalcarata]
MVDLVKVYLDKFKTSVSKLYANGLFDLILRLIEGKTGVPSVLIAIGLFSLLAVYLIVGWGNDFICNLITLIYPVYASFLTIHSGDSSDQKKLLNYWVIYSLLGCFEYIFHGLCDFLRTYWLGKFCFFMWFIQSESSSTEPNPEPDLNELSQPKPSIPRKKATSTGVKRTQTILPQRSAELSRDAKWAPNGVVVAGGHGNGSDLNQLYAPRGVFVDDDQNVYVIDLCNNRIVAWVPDATEGLQVIGGVDEKTMLDKLSGPVDLILEKDSDNFIVSDDMTKRVVRWRLEGDTSSETIISGFECKCLATDENGSIYIVDRENNEVIRYNIGDSEATIVAGGNGAGDALNQLNCPYSVFVDQDYSVYVSDEDNHRVMKWADGATEGVIVAGGQGNGDSLSQLSYPRGIVVDPSGTLYVADFSNARVMRWFKDAKQGEVIAGGNGEGEEPNQLTWPSSLAFDRHGNLYVSNSGSARVVKFEIA